MREKLLQSNKAELGKTFDEYRSKQPGTLTSQFNERRTKAEAIANQARRTEKVTELVPAGNSNHLPYMYTEYC